MDIRVIISSTDHGERECVIFTEDFETPVGDYLKPGFTVDCDEIRDLDLPDGFPLESTLERD
jgi:hypothetical protein